MQKSGSHLKILGARAAWRLGFVRTAELADSVVRRYNCLILLTHAFTRPKHCHKPDAQLPRIGKSFDGPLGLTDPL